AIGLSGGTASALPMTVGKPPPGSVPGTFPCSNGDDHELAGYGRDLGCLLTNVTLASLAGSLNAEWSRGLAPQVIRLAKHASTLWQPASTPYGDAVSILLTPVELHAADFELGEGACAHAVQAAEAACLAFYCGAPGLRPASAELTETVRRLERVCSTELACKPHEHGLDPV